ncbi:MAG: YiiD C-terminal domain-containing protein [Bdellovibrio sp.]|nr:YiiD C-terminal domain-containing protein [Bdellovibrio sp.]
MKNPNLSLQKIIQHEIPITQSMGITYDDFQDTTCVISVPLAPNHNHKGTAFGGSLYSACAAAGYGLLYHLQVKENLIEFDLLLASGNINYLKPVQDDFQVEATIITDDWTKLLKKLNTNGFGKIVITAHVMIGEEKNLCDFSGVFVLKSRKP